MKNKTMKRILPALLLAALVLGMTGCGQTQSEPDVSAAAETTAAPASDPVTLLEPMDRQAELKTAAKKNEDTKAWLCIPGAEVDDAVMQTENNAYYLYLDETETYSPWGCYYADCRDTLESREKLAENTVVYGHAASDCDKDGPKFTKLFRYMDAGYVQENPYIYLSVDGEDMIFQITAVFVTDTEFDYIRPEFETDKERTEYLETVARKNLFAIDGAAIEDGDKLLTLSTCCTLYDKDGTGDQRLVVVAKLLPAVAEEAPYAVQDAESPELPEDK